MSQSYIDRYFVAGTNEQLMLYKRADLENNDAWWYRAKLKGKIGYIRRSTRETERVLAERFAVEEWHNLLGKQKAGLKLTAKLVRDVVKDFFEQVSATKTERRAKYQFNTWYRYMDGYFGEQKISEITDGFVEGYWNYRKGFYVWGEGRGRAVVNKNRKGGSKTSSSNNINPNPSYGTLRAEASIINEFFAWCYKDAQGYIGKKYSISARSAFTKTETIPFNRRPHFERSEWNRLTRNLESYADNTGAQQAKRANAWHLRKRKMFRAYVLFLASTGLRVGEARLLRWQDISTANDKTLKRKVLLVNVRGHTSKVRQNRTAVAHSENIIKIMDWWKKHTEFSGKEDLIFYNTDTDGIQKTCDLSTTFRDFLKSMAVEGKKDGLLKNADGEKRTLYSLRHTYATFRLESGVEVYALAKVMGTGVTQIEKHYGHVATERLMTEVIKGSSRAESEQRRDLEYAANLITQLRAGDTTVEIVAERLAEIADVATPIKKS
jgi:integrase